MSSFVILAMILSVSLLLIILAVVVYAIHGGQVEEKFPFKLKKYFFTRSEQMFLSMLEEKIDHSHLTIFPKVRLGDLIETTASGDEWQGSWNKIRSKHVDFLIYDTKNQIPVLAIELDGNSHNSERMQKSDDFKNKLYPALGLELVRVKVGSVFETEIATIVAKLVQSSEELSEMPKLTPRHAA